MREKISDKKERAIKISEIFDKVYNDADCTLDYKTPFQLLISTQLAAQCTDARVNIVTEHLFKKYPTIEAFAAADELELQQDIKSTGFFRNKAKNIIGTARMLIDDYNGEVPSEMDDLLKLPGVGRKTANLVRGDAFGIPGVVVDTHASRISKKLGFTTSSDPHKIEVDLMKILPQNIWTKFCHQLVYHGRAYCGARSQKCELCPISMHCPSLNQ